MVDDVLANKVASIEHSLRRVREEYADDDESLYTDLTHQDSILLTDHALINTMVGEYDAALNDLESLLAIPSMVYVPFLRLDPRWKPLHSHPGFQRLLRAEGEN